MIRFTSSLLALAALAAAQTRTPMFPVAAIAEPSDAGAVATVQESRAIDLVICLDISGSMNGLINAARQNLWAIVNDMATLKPQPELRVALLTYGSPAYGQDTGFVSVQTKLTNDLDLVSQKLFALTTNGGKEYVARVVKRSLDELEWSKDSKALKMIFVAGNEAATQDPEHDAYQIAKAAIERGILVNTLYCGNQQKSEAEGWRQVARMADGQFTAIEHNQQQIIESPFDQQLGALSTQLNGTYVLYGDNRVAWGRNQIVQDTNVTNLNLAAVAQRCQTKGGKLYYNPQVDLVDAVKDPKFDLFAIAKKDLPEKLRKLSNDQLKSHVDEMAKKRGALQKQVAELGKKRDAYVKAEQEKRAANGEKLFEQAMLESVRSQARSRGFERSEPKRVTEPVVPVKVEPPQTESPTQVVPVQQVTPVVPASRVRQVQPVAPVKQAPVKQTPAKQAPAKVLDKRFVEVVKNAAAGYQNFHSMTGWARHAPTDCRMPPPAAKLSKAGKAHGGKLYLLYARNKANGTYVEKGVPAKVGQTLVKEAWERRDGMHSGTTDASKRYWMGLTASDGSKLYHAGDARGLFVMHKLAADTPGTDQGWVYGTIDKGGKVTGAGRMASCIKCHQRNTNDRRFGLK